MPKPMALACAGEADLNGLVDIPVIIKQTGVTQLECKLNVEFYSDDGCAYTVGQVKRLILQEKVRPVPEVMMKNPDNCFMLMKSDCNKILENDELMRKYAKELAKTGVTLTITDTIESTLNVNF